MANPAFETVEPPFTAFRFEVVLELDDPPVGVTNPVCNAAFAECDGLEMSMEPKVVREGGNNREQIHLVGPVSYSQLTLRRGMTNNLDLWRWFIGAAQPGRRSTAQGQVTLWGSDGTPQLTFVLTKCLPVKMRGPSLNAREGTIAIEEMQLVYATLDVRPAGEGASFGISASFGVSAGVSVGASVGGSFSAEATADLSF